MNGYIKVPFRPVYCESFRQWIAETIYCHVVLRIKRPKFGPFSK